MEQEQETQHRTKKEAKDHTSLLGLEKVCCVWIWRIKKERLPRHPMSHTPIMPQTYPSPFLQAASFTKIPPQPYLNSHALTLLSLSLSLASLTLPLTPFHPSPQLLSLIPISLFRADDWRHIKEQPHFLSSIVKTITTSTQSKVRLHPPLLLLLLLANNRQHQLLVTLCHQTNSRRP